MCHHACVCACASSGSNGTTLVQKPEMTDMSQKLDCAGSTGAARSNHVATSNHATALGVDALFCHEVEMNCIRGNCSGKRLGFVNDSERCSMEVGG